MLTLYSMPSSGNSYKVRLTLAHLGLRFEHITTAWYEGRELTKQADFLKLNPAGIVPLLQLEDGRTLSESNAIALYLAEGSELVPNDRFDRAKMLEWMFFEQYNHEPAIAVRGGILTLEERAHLRTPEVLGPLLDKGHGALATMDRQLGKTSFLAAEEPTLADICLYAYTHSAGAKGGFEMDRFPSINNWLARVASLPGHVPLNWLPS